MPDTRRFSQRWQASPPGDGPPPTPRHAAPTGHAGQGNSVGPPHPHTRAHSMWVADPNSPPGGRAVGGGTAPDLRHPSQWWKAAPPGTPFGHPHERATPRRKGARCGAGAGSPRPHRPHPGHTGRGTPAARSRGRAAGGGTAPDTRRPSHRWQASPPGDVPPPPPRHAAPTGHAGQGDSVGPPHPPTHAHSTGGADPNSPPSGRAVREGGAPDHRRPSQRWKAPPRERPSATPTASNAGPQGRTLWGRSWVPGPHRPHAGHTGRGSRLPAPEGEQLGEGQRLTPDAPQTGGRPAPPGTAPHHPRGTQPPTGHAGQGDSVGPPHPHTRAHSTGGGSPTARPVGGQFGKGERLTTDAPHNSGRHPPGNALLPPPQRATPARKGARCGAGAGSQARTDCTRDTRVAEAGCRPQRAGSWGRDSA